jgi:hypothetical protein
VLVWAVTAVLSSARVFDPIDDEDGAELFSSELELEDDEGDDPAVVCPSAAADEPELPAGEVCDSAPPADDPPESEPPEPSEPNDDWPESSASATLTCGPATAPPNSAALTPAEAAPTCNHHRTPKLSDRRGFFDR